MNAITAKAGLAMGEPSESISARAGIYEISGFSGEEG